MIKNQDKRVVKTTVVESDTTLKKKEQPTPVGVPVITSSNTVAIINPIKPDVKPAATVAAKVDVPNVIKK